MVVRSLLTAIGAAFVAFVITAVVVIEIVEVDPGAGILGVGLGAFVGLGVLGLVALKVDDVSGPLRWATEAVAGFGWTVLFLLFLSYGNIAGLRGVVSPRAMLVLAAAVGVVVFAGNWFRNERAGPA